MTGRRSIFDASVLAGDHDSHTGPDIVYVSYGVLICLDDPVDMLSAAVVVGCYG